MDMHTTIEELLVFYAVYAETDVLVQVFLGGEGRGMQSHLCTGVFHGNVQALSLRVVMSQQNQHIGSTAVSNTTILRHDDGHIG
jgi:hypothetical protein